MQKSSVATYVDAVPWKAHFLLVPLVRLMTKMAAVHSVNQIGTSFVKQYYLQMHQNPSQLHRFYQEDSSLAHGGNELGTSEPVKGQKVRVGDPSVYVRGVCVCVHACVCVCMHVFVSPSMCVPSCPHCWHTQAIHEKIQSLDLTDCRARIKQVDSHATLGNGIVIQVCGEGEGEGEGGT